MGWANAMEHPMRSIIYGWAILAARSSQNRSDVAPKTGWLFSVPVGARHGAITFFHRRMNAPPENATLRS
jgi:hypothetical protein